MTGNVKTSVLRYVNASYKDIRKKCNIKCFRFLLSSILKVQTISIDQLSSNKLIEPWLLLLIRSLRFEIYFGCLLNADLKVLLIMLKTSLSNFYVHLLRERKHAHSFNPKLLLWLEVITLALSTLCISIQITNSHNANISNKTVQSFYLFLWTKYLNKLQWVESS